MKDRVSAKPGRMLITPEGSGEPFYATVALADEPTVEGTPLNKASLLQDTTAGALGLDSTATVNDAFVGVLKKLGLTPVFLTVTVGGATAKAGIPINGVTNADGSQLVTDGVTQTYLCFSESTNVSASVSGYKDLPNRSVSGNAPDVGILELALAISAPTNGSQKFTTSTSNIKFSPYISKLDVCCIGGGGGGGGAYTDNGHPNCSGYGGGGGGGHLVNQYNVPIIANEVYRVIVGSGGRGGKSEYLPENGGSGSRSAFRKNDGSDDIVSANGGTGGGAGNYNEDAEDPGEGQFGSRGEGNGNGGKANSSSSASPGQNSTDGNVFGSSSLGAAGGGGGPGCPSNSTSRNGGSPYGGIGAIRSEDGEAGAGTGDGGGGGGGVYGKNTTYGNPPNYSWPGADGYRGAVYLRWEVSLT